MFLRKIPVLSYMPKSHLRSHLTERKQGRETKLAYKDGTALSPRNSSLCSVLVVLRLMIYKILSGVSGYTDSIIHWRIASSEWTLVRKRDINLQTQAFYQAPGTQPHI